MCLFLGVILFNAPSLHNRFQSEHAFAFLIFSLGLSFPQNWLKGKTNQDVIAEPKPEPRLN
jgi:hypothetical protein